MPPGVEGLGESGSGARRVHSTKPSGRGAPEATPRLKGSARHRRVWESAGPTMAGAAIRLAAPAPRPATTRRRSIDLLLRKDIRIAFSGKEGSGGHHRPRSASWTT